LKTLLESLRKGHGHYIENRAMQNYANFNGPDKQAKIEASEKEFRDKF
jgi:hypothetical protein